MHSIIRKPGGRWFGSVAALGLAALVGTAFAQDPAPRTRATDDDAARRTEQTPAATNAPLTMRASRVSGTVDGFAVENPAGEKVGKVEDLVIDMRTGKVTYAAVSTGGFLGVGDRLHAIPFEALQLAQRDDDYLFVLDVDRKRLENAPGFDKGNWPDFADPQWAVEVDRFYQDDVKRPRTSAFRPSSEPKGALQTQPEKPAPRQP